MELFGPPNISKLKAERNLKSLRKALRYKDWKIRKDAACVLCEWKEPQGIAFLRENLSNPEGTIALESAGCLADFGDPSGVQVLIRSLHKSPRYVAEKLGKLKNSDAVDPLLQELDSWISAHSHERGADWTLPRALAKSIVTIGGLRILPSALERELLLYEFLQSYGEELVPEIIRVLLALDENTRNQVTSRLGAIASASRAPALFRLGFSVDVTEKLLCPDEVQEVFKRQYLEADLFARWGIIEIIASRSTAENLAFLFSCIYDPEESVAAKAVDALMGWNSQFKEQDEIVGRLAKLLLDPAISMGTKLHLAGAVKDKWSPATDSEKAYFSLLELERHQPLPKLGPTAAHVFVCGLLHPPAALRSMKILEVMLRKFPGKFAEEDLRKIDQVKLITSETPAVHSDGADGLYTGSDTETHSAHNTRKLAMEELKRRGLIIEGERS